MVMDDPVQKIPTTLVTADSTGAPDAGGLGCHCHPALRFNRNSKELTQWFKYYYPRQSK